ncbi:MAG: hypothetical protein PHC97_01020 [Patescibacteria group bacterium]|nr:hypothetical protein [Patescibacteria group bacterium]
MEGFPRLEEKIVFFGHLGLHLEACNLDILIDLFGEPLEDYSYIETNPRVRILRFNHALGTIYAYVVFTDLDFSNPKKRPVLFPDRDDRKVDRGFLVELHLELISPELLRVLGDPVSIINNKPYQFAIVNKICLARMIYKKYFDAVCFINPLVINGVKNSFMFAKIWPVDEQIKDLREVKKQFDEEEQSEKIDREKRQEKIRKSLIEVRKGPCN